MHLQRKCTLENWNLAKCLFQEKQVFTSGDIGQAGYDVVGKQNQLLSRVDQQGLWERILFPLIDLGHHHVTCTLSVTRIYSLWHSFQLTLFSNTFVPVCLALGK